MNSSEKQHFFVSYNRHDRAFAEWIAWVLEEAGHLVTIQAWDFRAGENFVEKMHRAAMETDATIAVLSETYLKSGFTLSEWAAAFAQDPTGEKRKLIPVRVKECDVLGLLGQIVYVDLVGLAEEEAEDRLLREIAQRRSKPNQKPKFPGQEGARADRPRPVYPPEIPENLPRLSDVFVGRSEDLERLHEQVKRGKPTAISAIAGMGGIGKTELAAQYANQQRELGFYAGGVLWLSARMDLGEQIIEFVRDRLPLEILEEVEPEKKVQHLWKQWQPKETLIVFDDVQDYQAIQRFLPPQRSYFKVLLTTRSHFGSPVENYEIKVLSEAASLELLRGLVPDGRIDQDLLGAKQLCDWLGYLPLGLELVGRYLARKPGTSIAKLWQRLQEQRLAAKALLEAEPGITASLGVTAAFELSWQELTADAQQLAAFLSLFALAEIPWSIVQQCVSGISEEALEGLRDEQLVNLSLLSFERDGMYQLHQLLREFFAAKRSTMPEDEAMKQSFCSVMVSISNRIPYPLTLEVAEQVAPAIPHLKEAATTLSDWLAHENLITPATRIAWFYEGQLAFGEAEKWYLHCRERATQRLGENHVDVATSLNNLANLYEFQGRYGEAEPLYVQSLETSQRQLNENHPDIATTLNNLAELYRLQGRYGEAELLYQQSLEIRQRQLGEDHTHVAVSLSSLAALYESQGQYGEAEPLYVRSLEILRQQFGKDHPHVATALNNLAELYRLQGRYGEAEPLYQQSLEIRQRQLGEDHPYVATTLNNLALLHYSQGRLDEAKQFFMRSLEIRQQHLGENHPNVAGSLNNLAGVYFLQGRYREAELLFQQALEIYRRQLGGDHPDVAQSLNNLAGVYKSQGRYREAELLFQQALEIYRRQLGSDHPDVARSLNNLAGAYYLQERYGEAESLYQQALEIYYQRLGKTHPNTQTVLRNFRYLLQQVISCDRTSDLSDHPMTRSLLEELQNEKA